MCNRFLRFSCHSSNGEINELQGILHVIRCFSDKCSDISFRYASRSTMEGVDILGITTVEALMPLLYGFNRGTKMLRKFPSSNALLPVLLWMNY